MRAPELTALYEGLKNLPAGKPRADFGKEINKLKQELEVSIRAAREPAAKIEPVDITAPMDINTQIPVLGPAEEGGKHPLMSELETILEIFGRMGFSAIESREIDDDYHMFSSLNFPEDHPARDDYEHTFYQLEGVYVDEAIHAGHLIATLKTFLEEYYQQQLRVKTQPFYFPFTEPSFEFALSCPFCGGSGCHICSQTGWIELLGCGMIHPNVLRQAGVDPVKYSGFAWGGGIDRLVMMKYGIEDVRHFHSGNLKFLRQFS
jgi:phenylalanyl-tRNA synthetase alpha chain